MCAREAKNSLSPHLAHLACGSPLLSGVGTPNRTRRDPGRAAVRSVAPVLLGRETPQGRGERQPAWWNPPWGPVLRRVRGSNHLTPEGPPGCYLFVLFWVATVLPTPGFFSRADTSLSGPGRTAPQSRPTQEACARGGHLPWSCSESPWRLSQGPWDLRRSHQLRSQVPSSRWDQGGLILTRTWSRASSPTTPAKQFPEQASAPQDSVPMTLAWWAPPGTGVGPEAAAAGGLW